MFIPLFGLAGLGQTYTPAQIQSMIVQAANQYGVPPSIALGIASHESGFNPNATHLNTNGTTDYGVMQLNSTTVQTLGVQNPLDPQQNINAGVSLLASYLNQYGGNVNQALQAYASGPGSLSNPPNSVASQFIGYVTSYTPPAGLIVPDDGSGDIVASDSSGDSSSVSDALGLSQYGVTDTGLGIAGVLLAGLVAWAVLT